MSPSAQLTAVSFRPGGKPGSSRLPLADRVFSYVKSYFVSVFDSRCTFRAHAQDGNTGNMIDPTCAIQQTDRIPLLFAHDDHVELVIGYQETRRDMELLVLDPET